MKTYFNKALLNLDELSPTQYGELGLFSIDIPGVGGQIKVSPENFEVKEIPSYHPCGEGEHLFLWIEKRLLSADELLQHLAGCFKIPTQEIGMAGKKDRNAVTP